MTIQSERKSLPINWVIILIVLKILIIWKGLYFNYWTIEDNYFLGFWGNIGGDSKSYILPAENFYNTLTYAPNFRMPGYGVIYLLVRPFFNIANSCNVLLIIQSLTSIVGIYLLTDILYKHISNKTIVFFMLLIYTTNDFVYSFDYFLLTESFSVSASIFCFYFFWKWKNSYLNTYLILSSLFLTWLIFLRPAYILLFIPFLLVIVLDKKIVFKKRIINVLFFLSLFCICDSIWINHNYKIFRKFIPLMNYAWNPETESGYYLHAANLMQASGCSHMAWKPFAEIRYFSTFGFEKTSEAERAQLKLPKQLSNLKNYNQKRVTRLITLLREIDLRNKITEQEDRFLSKEFHAFELAYKEERKLDYIVVSRIRHTIRFYFKDYITYPIFNIKDSVKACFKNPINFHAIIESLVYAGALILWLIFIILEIKNKTILDNLVLISLSSYHVIFPFIRMPETRYIVPSFPFILFCAGISFYFLLKKNKTEQRLFFV